MKRECEKREEREKGKERSLIGYVAAEEETAHHNSKCSTIQFQKLCR